MMPDHPRQVVQQARRRAADPDAADELLAREERLRAERKAERLRLAAIVAYIIQTVATQAITTQATALGLTAFWIAVGSLLVSGLGALLLFLPKVQGFGQPQVRAGDVAAERRAEP